MSHMSELDAEARQAILSGSSTMDLIDELEKRVNPEKAEYDPGAVMVYAMQGGEEGVIVKYVPYGYEGKDKKPETVRYGIYNARIIVVIENDK